MSNLVIFIVVVTVLSIISCHAIAKSRGAEPVFWGVMGALFGPFAIPFAFFAKAKENKKIK